MTHSRFQRRILGLSAHWVWALALPFCLVAPSFSWGGPRDAATEAITSTATVDDRANGRGIDPSTACTDTNGDGKFTADECGGRDWSWTATDPQIPAAVNNQNGTGVPAGASNAAIGQTATQSITSGPHLRVTNSNTPAQTSTATTGYSSSGSSALRNQHNEYGFEIIVDKKTDPLEPYYQQFSTTYAVDSQTDANGDMVGQATLNYEKVVTEEDPNNPGVFNRYTVTGTATSAGTTGSFSSACQSGCPTDTGGAAFDPETGWTHPWQ